MIYFLKIEKCDNMQKKFKKTSFRFSTIIIIMVVTAIISGFAAGIIVYTSYNRNTGINYDKISSDPALKQFLEVYNSVSNDYYEDINKTEMINAAMKGMLNYLDDNYTTYLNEDETSLLNDNLKGEYQGIGVMISGKDIIQVFKDSPAANAGLLAGDSIVSVNGEDASFLDTNAIVSKIKSSAEAYVSLKVTRNGSELSFEIPIKNLYVPAIEYNIIDDSQIGYMQIASFSSSLDKQVENALSYFSEQNIKSLIIDLRGNSGGYLKAAELVSNLFLEKNKVIYSLKGRSGNTTIKDTTSQSTSYPIVVLINDGTASAAEILASALKDSYGATLVGTKSFGKGKVQQVISLLDGSTAKYTSAKWYTPRDENIDKIGITPDITVDIETKTDKDGNIVEVIDRQLEKAIDILKN